MAHFKRVKIFLTDMDGADQCHSLVDGKTEFKQFNTKTEWGCGCCNM